MPFTTGCGSIRPSFKELKEGGGQFGCQVRHVPKKNSPAEAGLPFLLDQLAIAALASARAIATAAGAPSLSGVFIFVFLVALIATPRALVTLPVLALLALAALFLIADLASATTLVALTSILVSHCAAPVKCLAELDHNYRRRQTFGVLRVRHNVNCTRGNS